MVHPLSCPRPSSLFAGKSLRASAFDGRGAGFSPRIDAEGRFSGYASLFGVMDMGRDVVMPGAFRDSLMRRGVGGVRLLAHHDPGAIIGQWSRIEEDKRGLYVEGRLDLGQSRGRALAAQITRGLMDGLSIGFRSEIERKDPATGIRHLDRLDLREISLVTFPLLPQARLIASKNAQEFSFGQPIRAGLSMANPAIH